MATKKPENPWLSYQQAKNRFGFDVGPIKHTTIYKTDGSVESYTEIAMVQRPDGVWELPK